jgi:succinate-semialdehyde dehydrogenase/glutarate-semialdehyde dehydrogenase
VERVEEYALLLTQEMGKPIAQSRDEILKAASQIPKICENARYLENEQVTDTEDESEYVTY